MKYYMDEDTFHQVGGENFEKFLRETPDINRYPFDKKEKSVINKSNQVDNQEMLKKEQACTSTEEFKTFMMLTWLELYLPRYELKYGMFEYSSSNLTNTDKINELLEYYANCGVPDIEHIRKNSFKAFRH